MLFVSQLDRNKMLFVSQLDRNNNDTFLLNTLFLLMISNLICVSYASK